MIVRQIFNSDSFKNVEENGKIIGYQFQFKAQYYRGITLSIVRDIEIAVDGVKEERKSIRFTVNGETFTLGEMRTVVDSDYRWEFGEYATVTVLKDGGIQKGKHRMHIKQIIAPSYMPFQLQPEADIDFVIE